MSWLWWLSKGAGAGAVDGACECTDWVDAECVDSSHRRQVRICIPPGCDIEEQIIDDPSCAQPAPSAIYDWTVWGDTIWMVTDIGLIQVASWGTLLQYPEPPQDGAYPGYPFTWRLVDGEGSDSKLWLIAMTERANGNPALVKTVSYYGTTFTTEHINNTLNPVGLYSDSPVYYHRPKDNFYELLFLNVGGMNPGLIFHREEGGDWTYKFRSVAANSEYGEFNQMHFKDDGAYFIYAAWANEHRYCRFNYDDLSITHIKNICVSWTRPEPSCGGITHSDGLTTIGYMCENGYTFDRAKIIETDEYSILSRLPAYLITFDGYTYYNNGAFQYNMMRSLSGTVTMETLEPQYCGKFAILDNMLYSWSHNYPVPTRLYIVRSSNGTDWEYWEIS